jgi:hypothetical protein
LAPRFRPHWDIAGGSGVISGRPVPWVSSDATRIGEAPIDFAASRRPGLPRKRGVANGGRRARLFLLFAIGRLALCAAPSISSTGPARCQT